MNKIILLPTENIASNGLQPFSAYSKPITKGGLILATNKSMAQMFFQIGKQQAYHLYIVDENPISDGDFVIKLNGRYPKVYKENGQAFCNTQWLNSGEVNDCYRIVASSDDSLGLTGISKELMQQYIKKYSSGGIGVANDLIVEDGEYDIIPNRKRFYNVNQVEQLLREYDTLLTERLSGLKSSALIDDFIAKKLV